MDVQPEWAALTGEHLFWTSWRKFVRDDAGEPRSAPQELSRLALRGGTPEVIAGGLMPGWAGLAADDAHLYVGGADARLHRITLDGSEDIALADVGGEWASQLRIVPPHVYWSGSSGSPVTGDAAAEVRRVRTDGTAPAEVLWGTSGTSYANGLAVGGGHFFTAVFNWPQDFSAGLQPDGQILRFTPAGNAGDVGMPLVDGLLVPRLHAADDRYVYFTAQNADRYDELWRVPVSGGAPELLRSAGPRGDSPRVDKVDVGQMLVSDDTVWWGQANDGRLLRATAGGETSTVTSVDTHHMLGLAGDDTYLYFTTRDGYDVFGREPPGIWRVARDCPPSD